MFTRWLRDCLTQIGSWVKSRLRPKRPRTPQIARAPRAAKSKRPASAPAPASVPLAVLVPVVEPMIPPREVTIPSATPLVESAAPLPVTETRPVALELPDVEMKAADNAETLGAPTVIEVFKVAVVPAETTPLEPVTPALAAATLPVADVPVSVPEPAPVPAPVAPPPMMALPVTEPVDADALSADSTSALEKPVSWSFCEACGHMYAVPSERARGGRTAASRSRRRGCEPARRPLRAARPSVHPPSHT